MKDRNMARVIARILKSVCLDLACKAARLSGGGAYDEGKRDAYRDIAIRLANVVADLEKEKGNEGF